MHLLITKVNLRLWVNIVCNFVQKHLWKHSLQSYYSSYYTIFIQSSIAFNSSMIESLSYWNQSIDCYENQPIGFYMIRIYAMKKFKAF